MENLIEELTKVNPSNLSEEGLKLFNKINEIIDRNIELEKENNNFKKTNKKLYEIKEFISRKMKYLFIDSSGIDQGRYEAYNNILNFLQEGDK